MALAVENVEDAVDELEGKGITILEKDSESPVCYWAIVADPDGNPIWLHHRKDGTAG